MFSKLIKNQKLSFLRSSGFFHIFSSQMLNVILQFATSVVLVRVLTKEDYGIWMYALNILSFFLLFQGLGVVQGILQYSSTSSKSLSYLKYGTKVGIVVNTSISIILFLFTLFVQLPVKGSSTVLNYLFLVPLFTILFEIIQIYLRATFRNQKYSLLSTTNALVLFISSTIGAYFMELNGVILSRYLAYFICIVLGIILIRKDLLGLNITESLDVREKKEFLNFSITSAFNNSISSVVYLVDTFLIGIIIQSEVVVASYKTATLIPFGLNFIPMSIMIYAYPYFAKMSTKKEELKNYFYKLQMLLLLLNLIITAALIIFAPYIITTMFGDDYLDAVTPFRILCVGYLIAGTFRIPAGNLLASIKKVKVNLIVTIISGVCNIVFDLIFINLYGPVGAAFATVSVFIISSVFSNAYLYFYFKKNNT